MSNHLIARDYSLRPVDLIPPDEEDEEEMNTSWLDYCAEASRVDRAHILQCVLSDLDADDSPLYRLIDSALKCPHEPGQARESIVVLAAVGQEILNMVAASVDAQVNLQQLVRGEGR